MGPSNSTVMTDLAPFLSIAFVSCALFPLGCGSADALVGPSGMTEIDAAPEAGIDAFAADAAPTDDAPSTDASDDAPSVDASDDRPKCPLLSTSALAAKAAKSGSFSGGDIAYFMLYGVPCQATAECAAACVSAGGTSSSCEVGSQCVTPALGDSSSHCLPPTYWRNADGAVSESGVTATAAELTLVSNDFHDALIITGFDDASIPENATVAGIEIEVRRNADDAFAVDDSVRLLKDGAPVGPDHRRPGAWPRDLTYATYGGMDDTWGTSWSPGDFSSAGFGITIAPKYTGMAGNDRAHVDSARATIFFTTPCP